MRRMAGILMICGGVLLTAATLLAHEVTHMGTVVAVIPGQPAAVDGVLAKLEVKDVDSGQTAIFDMTSRTKLWRGDGQVAFDVAHIEKDERVAVTIDHDNPGSGALEVKLAAHAHE